MSGYCKYYKQKKQVSYDSGATWQDVVPAEYQIGELYENNSVDCGYQYVERWINSGTTCQGYNKYYVRVKQISNDGGATWSTTSETHIGDLIQANSVDCGYVPTTDMKAIFIVSGATYTLECNDSSLLTESEIENYVHHFTIYAAEIGDCVTGIDEEAFFGHSGMTSIVIPNNVTYIGVGAFNYCTSLTSINIPDSVTTIGTQAFYDCSGLTAVTIGSGVTNIGYYAFRNCSSLTSFTVNATTPPPMGVDSLANTNNCPIYVPASSVDAYKSADLWRDYADRIQAIPT